MVGFSAFQQLTQSLNKSHNPVCQIFEHERSEIILQNIPFSHSIPVAQVSSVVVSVYMNEKRNLFDMKYKVRAINTLIVWFDDFSI